MIKPEIREWLCEKGHVFWHMAAVPEVEYDLLEIAKSADINARVRCLCGAISVMEFPVGEISDGDTYPLLRQEGVTVPEGKYLNKAGQQLQQGGNVELEVRNISTLLSALELGEEG